MSQELYYEVSGEPLKEVGFGLDDFREPKVLDTVESLEQIFNNIFGMRPGTHPSRPHLGIDIKRYLYSDSVDEDELKQAIYANCSELFSYVEYDDIIISPVEYQGENVLIILIPLQIDGEALSVYMSFQRGKGDSVMSRFKAVAQENTGGDFR